MLHHPLPLRESDSSCPNRDSPRGSSLPRLGSQAHVCKFGISPHHQMAEVDYAGGGTAALLFLRQGFFILYLFIF